MENTNCILQEVATVPIPLNAKIRKKIKLVRKMLAFSNKCLTERLDMTSDVKNKLPQ